MLTSRRRYSGFAVVCGAVAAGVVVAALPIAQETENVPVDRLAANLERMIADKPQDVSLRLNLARAHALAFAQKLDAIQVLKRNGLPFFGYEFSPQMFQVLPPKDQATAAAAEAQLKAAIVAYRELLKLDPDHSVGNLGLGWCLSLAGDREGAKAALRRTIALEWPREKDRQSTWGSMVLEAWGHLRPLLDPVTDAAELRTMVEHQAVINKQGRMVTPIAVPLRARLDAYDIADDRASVLFDADGSGIPKRWTWITDDAAWLVFDRKDTRTVTSALQWFGSVTFWLFWDNGYDALRALDDDGDGKIRGAELNGFALWHDRDRDGVSDKGEVRPAASHGIVALSTRYEHDPHHPDEIAWSRDGVTFSTGEVRATYDLVLRTGRK